MTFWLLCAGVIVMFHIGFVLVRRKAIQSDTFGIIAGVLAAGLILLLKTDIVKAPVIETFRPLGFPAFLALGSFAGVTCILRMLIEQFRLGLPYTRREWRFIALLTAVVTGLCVFYS